MLLEGNLTNTQKTIIRHICSIQLESLQRIYNNEAEMENGEKLSNLLQINDLDEEAFDEELIKKIKKFQDLHEDPNKLSQMSDSNLSVITHIMTNIAEKYQDKYPNAVRNIWRKLFFLRDVKLNVNMN